MRTFPLFFLLGCVGTVQPDASPPTILLAEDPVAADEPGTDAPVADEPAFEEPSPLAAGDVALFAVANLGETMAVPLVCRIDGEPLSAVQCATRLPTGTQVTLPGLGHTHLGERGRAECPMGGDPPVPGFLVVPGDDSDVASLSVGFLGHEAMPALMAPKSMDAGAEVRARVLSVANQTHSDLFGDVSESELVVTIALSGNLDGQEGDERIVRVWRSSGDTEKPGNSALFLDSGEQVIPLTNPEWFDVNGIIDVSGALPIDGGHVLVLGMSWGGGDGSFAVSLRDGEREYLGGWSCGC